MRYDQVMMLLPSFGGIFYFNARIKIIVPQVTTSLQGIEKSWLQKLCLNFYITLSIQYILKTQGTQHTPILKLCAKLDFHI